jgi:outer membrane protein assembly factor BamB
MAKVAGARRRDEAAAGSKKGPLQAAALPHYKQNWPQGRILPQGARMRSMRQVVASALMVAAIPLMAGIPGCGLMESRGSIRSSEPLPDLGQIGLKRSWQRSLPMAADEHIKEAWRINNSIYVTTSYARIARIDAKSGVLAFDKELGRENLQIYRPIELKQPGPGTFGEVLVATRSGALVFNMATGDVVRTGNFGVSVSCAPVIVGETICIGGAGRYYGFFVDRFNKRWSISMPGDLFFSTPAVVADTVILASKNGVLQRIDPVNGDWQWKDRKTNGQVLAGLTADGRNVYVPCMDQRLYAFSVERGAEMWQSQLEGTLDQTPAVGGSVVMCPARGRGLFGISKQDGSKKWMSPGVESVATVTGNHAWVGDVQGNLKSLNVETGEELASAQIPDAAFFVRNGDDDAVFVINRTGTVGAYLPAH